MPLAYASPLTDQIAAKVQEKAHIVVTSVKPSPVAGLFEVVYGQKIFYVDKDVKYAFVGHIFNATGDKDLTAARLKELSKVNWSTLPLKDAVKVVYGKGERKVAVLTDAKCTYCGVLEQNLALAGNVTVYNFIAPVMSNSRGIEESIICSKNPGKAWSDYMTKRIAPMGNVGKCDASKLDRNKALIEKLGFPGTPVLIFSNGETNPGSMDVEELNRRLGARSAK